MRVHAELASLETQGVAVWAQDGTVKYASKHDLDPAIRSQIATLKPEIVDYWQRSDVIPRELSGLQQAYWLGENTAFSQSAQGLLHLIFEGDFPSEERMKAALSALIVRHPPLAYSLGTDSPTFEPRCTPPPTIEYSKALAGQPANTIAALDPEEATLSAFGTGAPLFRIVMVDDGERICLHGLFRLVLFDAFSVTATIDELVRLADGKALPANGVSYNAGSFRQIEFKHKRQRVQARQYWTAKIESLPGPARHLGSASALGAATKAPAFTEHRHDLGAARYDTLKKRAQDAGVSINALLIACYLATLTRWNEATPCCASVMYSQRATLPEAHAGCIGNFGNLLLLGAPDPALSFVEQARAVQQDLYRAMGNASYDGVSVIRDWASFKGAVTKAGDPPMPFVFSTLIGNEVPRPRVRQVGHRMMTPQIWIDAQAFENENDLILSWDVLEGALPEGMAAEMFAYFKDWVRHLADTAETWQSAAHHLPPASQAMIEASNATERAFPEVSLIGSLFEIAASDPERIAFWHSEGSLDFGTLASKASQLAEHMCENGVGPGDHVIICGRRTVEQVIAIYAVLLASATYVPVTPAMPPKRIKRIIAQSAATTILGDSDALIDAIHGSPVMWTENYSSFLADLPGDTPPVSPTYPIDAEQLAYIIFTSGSTGTPKGVAIAHRAAVNTLQSCVRLFGLSQKDRLLAVSEITFDLSIFDLFLPVLTGCATILPNESDIADPAIWLDAATTFEATVWNSAPAILEMAATYAQPSVSEWRLPPSLRLFMASGDWVPLSLPETLSGAVPGATFVALGGATEASIWSNYFVVEDVCEGWRSIPYGRPLDNQRFYILDRNGQLCPKGVAGALHIAGEGLATGYINDAEQTASRFFFHDNLGQRLYDTGDRGRYLPSGDIEFLGRDDHQVQINGFRVELGEIDYIAAQHEDIERATAIYLGADSGSLHLAYVTVPGWAGSIADLERGLSDHLRAHLSDYMQPDFLHRVDAMPLSANGKIDRQQLEVLSAQAVATKSEPEAASEEAEAAPRSGSLALLEIVRSVLPGIARSDQNWFHHGCNSLTALHLLQRLNTMLGLTLDLPDIYRAQTVDTLADLIAGKSGACGNVVWLHKHTDPSAKLVVFVHPVGGSIGCYMPAGTALAADHNVIALCANAAEARGSIEEIAAHYSAQITDALSECKSVAFAGWSLGGSVALEMARLARGTGDRDVRVVTIDSYVGDVNAKADEPTLFARFLDDLQHLGERHLPSSVSGPDDLGGMLRQRFAIFKQHYQALERYMPAPPDIDVLSFNADTCAAMPGLRLLTTAIQTRHFITLPGNHYSILEGQAFERWLAALLGK